MRNQYKLFLDSYFSTLLSFIHTSRRLNKVLITDIKTYSEIGSVYDSNSTLILNDWTGNTEDGWARPFRSGIFQYTSQENYGTEIKSVLSREFCLIYCQAYEALERFLKDCVFYKIQNDVIFKNCIEKIFKIKSEITREQLKGGDLLYKAVKKIGKKTLQQLSKDSPIKFREFLNILSQTRHSITHSRAVISKSKIGFTEYHEQLFHLLFCSSEIDDKQLLIQLDFKKFELLLKKLAEFAFQIFKAFSIEEELVWNYEK